MFEEINMYSNALDLAVVYLHLYSTKIEGEEENLVFLFLCLSYIMPRS